MPASKQEDILFQIARELALNTKATQDIEKHLDKLNGSVATHQSLIHVLQEAVKAHNDYIAAQQKEKREVNSMWKRLLERIFDYIVIGALSLIGVALFQYIAHAINNN